MYTRSSALYISITEVITLCRSNTLDSNRSAKSMHPDAFVLNQHLRLRVLLLPKPPQTIYLQLVQEKRVCKKR